MNPAVDAITVVCAVGTATVAGTFFTFSTFTMKGLKRLDPSQGAAAMQAINREAPKAPFMLLLFGTGAACLALMIDAILHFQDGGAKLQILACLLYIVGVVVVTGLYHVPRNNQLDSIDPASAEGAAYWATYLEQWTRMNHVRTIAPLVAAVLLAFTLTLG